MLLGIGFVTVITAAITSSFVARLATAAQRREPPGERGSFRCDHLRKIDERLERIEAALARRL